MMSQPTGSWQTSGRDRQVLETVEHDTLPTTPGEQVGTSDPLRESRWERPKQESGASWVDGGGTGPSEQAFVSISGARVVG